MPNFRRFLSRRWLLAFAVVIVIAGVPMLHPYPRQSLFGPTIRGKPWCVWEAEVRYQVRRDEHEQTRWTKFIRWVGVKPPELNETSFFGGDKEILPLLFHLSADPDPLVRRKVVEVMGWGTFRDEASLPALRDRLQDNDVFTRLHAAWLIWDMVEDRQGIPALVKELASSNERHRMIAVYLLGKMTAKNPDLLDDFEKLLDDADFQVRSEAIRVMPNFGTDSVPALLRVLAAKETYLSEEAAQALGKLGSLAKDAIPALEEVAARPRVGIHAGHAQAALFAIDPERFNRFNPRQTNP